MTAQTFTTVGEGLYARGDGSVLARTWRGGPSRTFKGKGAKADAKAWRTETMAKRNRGEAVPTARVVRVRIVDECNRYLDGLEGLASVNPSTLESYRGRVRNLIGPSLGAKYCHEASKATVEAWMAGLLREGNAPLVIRQTAGLLARALDDAVERGVMASHGARKAKAPRAQVAPEYVSAPDRDAIDAITDEVRPWRRIVCLLALGAGLRFGEATGLRPDDVEQDSEGQWWLHVVRQWTRRGVFTLPKGDKARRVPVPASLVMALRSHEAAYGLSSEGTYAQGAGGGPLAASTWRNEWERACAATGVELEGVHMLRHAYGSYHVAAGESIANVSVWMGHASIATTMAYYVKPIRDARPSTDLLARPTTARTRKGVAH